jgi:hypothetical protein
VALDVAVGLDVAGTAAMLLEPFRIETLTREHAGKIAAAAGRYGEQWTRGVIDGWFEPRHHHGADRYEWTDRLPGLCDALDAAGTPEVARLLTTKTWHWMDSQLRSWITIARTEVRRPQLEMLSTPLTRLLEAASDTSRDAITAALRQYDDAVLECLMPALRSALPHRPAWLDAVARDCVQRLGAIIATPPRDADDWSIDWTGCQCNICDTLGTFLRSRSDRRFEWPLAKDGRRHVHTHIDTAALPVRHQTRRQGRPYSLVLTKTDDLFTRAENARQEAVTDLARLTTAWDGASTHT